MFKSFEVIETFIKDVFDCSFLQQPINTRIKDIGELRTAHTVVNEIINRKEFSFSEEFIEHVFPIIEVAIQWDELKSNRKISANFIENCRRRLSASGSNFRGAIFEIDMATRCLLSDWRVEFPEDYVKKEKQVDLLIEKTNGEILALECAQKRGASSVKVSDINEIIKEKCKKFSPKHLGKLRQWKGRDFRLDKKAIIVDLTTSRYMVPAGILENQENIKLCKNIDGIILTWREKEIKCGSYSVKIKYRVLGNLPDKYFSTTWAAEFRLTGNRPVFFLRKYVGPEPFHSTWGPEERFQGIS